MPARFREQFTPVYLTLISIIQASVLGYIMLYLHDPRAQLTLWTSARLLGSFLFLVGTWYGYACGAIAFRWVPGLADAAIPFALGAFEFLAVRSAGSVFWWCMCNAGFALTGALSYLNQYRCAARYPENASVLGRLSRLRTLNPAFMGFCATWYVGVALLSGAHGRAEGIATLCGLLPPVGFLIGSPVNHRVVLGPTSRAGEPPEV
jgi:hypothetical protein